MSFSLAACMIIVAPSATSVTTLKEDTAHKAAGFPIYKTSETALGYKLTAVHLFKLTNGKAVVKASYVNPESKNQFDLIQTPANGSSAGTHIKGLVTAGSLETELLPESTFVTIRRGNTDIGFIGTLVSGPSAEKVLKSLRPWAN